MIPICTEIENLIHPVQFREDEYINESGLICCSKCGHPDRSGLRSPDEQ